MEDADADVLELEDFPQVEPDTVVDADEPDRSYVPMLTVVAVVENEQVLGFDLAFTAQVPNMAFGAHVLNAVKEQLNDISRTTELVGRLLGRSQGS